MVNGNAGIFLQANGLFCSKFWHSGGKCYVCITDCEYIEQAMFALQYWLIKFEKENPNVEVYFTNTCPETIALRKARKIKIGRKYISKMKISKKEIQYIGNLYKCKAHRKK